MSIWIIWILTTGMAGAFIGYIAAPTDFFWELIGSGFVVGTAQWFVLRRYMNAVWWIPLSGFGWILGVNFRILAGENLKELVDFLTSVGGFWEVFWLNSIKEPINFAVLGFVQWLLLRRQFRYAFWWIFASALSGAIRGAVASYVCAVACKIAGGTISNGLGWAASAAVTGIFLIQLISNYSKNCSKD
ncbi:MAG: hypothetical protein VKN72_15490 [Nostocales cyanobacterium 94392]|nr:hypothetical protein [Nostocales cyanobacterium 94392]